MVVAVVTSTFLSNTLEYELMYLVQQVIMLQMPRMLMAHITSILAPQVHSVLYVITFTTSMYLRFPVLQPHSVMRTSPSFLL